MIMIKWLQIFTDVKLYFAWLMDYITEQDSNHCQYHGPVSWVIKYFYGFR